MRYICTYSFKITAVSGPVILYSTTYNFTRSNTSIEIVRVLMATTFANINKNPFALSKVGYISPMR